MKKWYTELAFMILLASYLQHIGLSFYKASFWILQILVGIAVQLVCEQIFKENNGKY